MRWTFAWDRRESKRSHFREELVKLFSPLFQEMIDNLQNPNSRYQHKGRIMIRFFPKEKLRPDDVITSMNNQFYTERKIYYLEQKPKQFKLF